MRVVFRFGDFVVDAIDCDISSGHNCLRIESFDFNTGFVVCEDDDNVIIQGCSISDWSDNDAVDE